jgi:hypothetical protein
VQSILAGLAVLVLAVGAKYVLNRLWQNSLAQDATDAIQAAVDMGLEVSPLGYGPQIRAVGTVRGQTVEISWRGGALGSRTEVLIGDQKAGMPLVTTKAELHDLMMMREE